MPFLEQAHQDSPPLHTSPDASKPGFSEPSSNSVTSGTCAHSGGRVSPVALGLGRGEPRNHSQAMGENQTPGCQDRKARAEGGSLFLSLATSFLGPRVYESGPGSLSGHTAKKSQPSVSVPQEEVRHEPWLSPSGQLQCEKVGEDHCGRKDGDSGAMVPRGGPASLDSAEPTVVPETPSQTIKRRSVEGMRKQNRVELSDTSSDDEDRLVIEL